MGGVSIFVTDPLCSPFRLTACSAILPACSPKSTEALLVDEELADQVWEAWDAGVIDNELTMIAWLLIAMSA